MSAAAKPAAKAAAPKNALTPRAKPVAPAKTKSAPTPELRYKMVQEAAYYLAEKNGFSGNSQEYWAQAEIQISNMIGEK